MSLLIPDGMKNFFNILRDYSEKNDLDFDDTMELYIGFAYLGGEELRYKQTPPELVPFASQGVDGVHYGYVIHAPEITLADYPVGELCPMDHDGVVLCGEDTNTAIENLLSFQIEMNDELDKVYKHFLKELHKYHIKASKSKSNRMFDKEGNGKKVKPYIPNNYKYIPTSDGIGALAPKDTFSENSLPAYDASDINAFAKFITWSEEAISKGLYGDALYYLKELFWNECSDKNRVTRISELLQKTYHALDRGDYALIIKKVVDRDDEDTESAL